MSLFFDLFIGHKLLFDVLLEKNYNYKELGVYYANY